jgi:hypothetical protein
MIEVLSPSCLENDRFFLPPPLRSKALGKDLLRQKMANLQARMGACEQRIHVIQQEQTAMNHTAIVIQHDQEEIAREQDKLKERQLNVVQDIQQVKQKHADIQQMEAFLTLALNALVYCALTIYRDQQKVKTELAKIEDNRQKIHQHVSKIHQNVLVIVQNFQQAWQKGRAIEHRAVHIQETHQAIEMSVANIERKRDYIRANIPLLVPHFHQQQYEKRDAIGVAKKIDQVKVAGWLKRIQDFCLWLITAISESVLHSIQYMQPWLIKADFSVGNPTLSSLISWTAMGALATTGMVEIHFSWDHLILKGTLLDLKVK